MAEERADVLMRNAEAGDRFKVYYDELFRQAKPIIFPLFDLPFQQNTQFTGRINQLEQISKYLSQQNTVAITNTETVLAQAIAGLGGVGKTQLAIEYAYRAYTNKSYQIIWFLNGQNIDADYLRLAAQLRVYGENPREIIEKTKQELQKLGNYLLIIDDAESYEAIKAYLPQTGRNGHVLITTRHRLDWPKMLELGVFALEEGLAYFEKVTDFDAEELEDVIYLIEKLLGLLPLALTQAGAFIKQTGISVKEYIEFFETKLKELMYAEDKARDYSQTIAVTWDININRIKQKYPQAEDLLRGMSCLAPTPNKIDQSWLSGLVADEQSRVVALSQLADYSMIERHQEPNNFLVHSLVQEVVFVNIQFEQKQNYMKSVFETLKVIFPLARNIHGLADFFITSVVLPHLENILKKLDIWLKQTTDIKFTKIIAKDLVALVEKKFLLHLISFISDGYGQFSDNNKQKNFLERTLEIGERYYGADYPQKSLILNNLAIVYGGLGNMHKKKGLMEEALRISEKYNGKDHYKVGEELNNLADAYGNLGYLNRQKETLERALAILKKHYGNEHPAVARSLVNLANAYGDLGNTREKKKLLEQALLIMNKYYEVDHPDSATFMVNLGNVYNDLNEPLKGKDLIEYALVTLKKHYGSEHPKVAAVLVNLSNAYARLNDTKQSEKLLIQALEIEEKYYGKYHPEVAKTQICLANLYGNLGQISKKIELLKMIISVIEKHYGHNYPVVAIALTNLGDVYRDQGNLQESKQILEQALAVFEKCYGFEHLHVARTLANLGGVYLLLGEVQKSKVSLERALLIEENYIGANAPGLATILNNLVAAYYRLGMFEDARIAATRNYHMHVNNPKYGAQHPEAIKSKQKLLAINQILSDPNLLKRAMAKVNAGSLPLSFLQRLEVQLAEKPHDMDLKKQLIKELYNQGKLSEALKHCEELLKINKEDAEGWYWLACLNSLINPEKVNKQNVHLAQFCFDKALAIKPTTIIHCEYGYYLLQKKQFELAQDQFCLAAKLPHKQEYLVFYAVDKPRLDGYLRRELTDQNVLKFEIEAMIDYGMIQCCQNLNDDLGQAEYLIKLTDLAEQQNQPELYQLLSYVYEMLGDQNEVNAMLAQALQLEEKSQNSNIQIPQPSTDEDAELQQALELSKQLNPSSSSSSASSSSLSTTFFQQSSADEWQRQIQANQAQSVQKKRDAEDRPSEVEDWTAYSNEGTDKEVSENESSIQGDEEDSDAATPPRPST